MTGFLPFGMISRSVSSWITAASASCEAQKILAVFTTIFTLPFCGNNFFRGIVQNRDLGFQKDSAYEFLRPPGACTGKGSSLITYCGR
jgi:hypothetical protein